MDKNSNILVRLGDILSAFDSDNIFSHLKLKGRSSIQILFLTEKDEIKPELNFDFVHPGSVNDLNEIRKSIAKKIPDLLLPKNMSINAKKTKLTAYSDLYVINDQKSKQTYEITIDYIYRKHILNPEYLARMDSLFKDIHVYSLSLLENYGLYIANFLLNKESDYILKYLVDNNKIMEQQIPFIRKIVLFYLSIETTNLNFKSYKLEQKYLDFLDRITNFSEQELKFFENLNLGIYDPSLLLPGTLAQKLVNHPKALIEARKRAIK